MIDVNIHLSGILLAYGVILAGILSPGPAVLGIAATSMERGRRTGMKFAMGVVCGSLFWGTFAGMGMAAVITNYVHALSAIKIAGAIYLFWLAWKSFKSGMVNQSDLQTSDHEKVAGKKQNAWLSGFIIHLTNPKGLIAWVATIALGVTPESPVWVSFAIVLGGVTLSLIGNMSYALLFSSKGIVWFTAALSAP